MANLSEYEQVLKNQIASSVFAIVLISILAITFFLLHKKGFFNDLGKIGKTVVSVFVTAVILSGTVHFSLAIYRSYIDLDGQAYITYAGTFEVSSFKEGYITIKNEGSSLTLSGKADLPGGEYTGIVVYAQNSKRLLEWFITS